MGSPLPRCAAGGCAFVAALRGFFCFRILMFRRGHTPDALLPQRAVSNVQGCLASTLCALALRLHPTALDMGARPTTRAGTPYSGSPVHRHAAPGSPAG